VLLNDAIRRAPDAAFTGVFDHEQKVEAPQVMTGLVFRGQPDARRHDRATLLNRMLVSALDPSVPDAAFSMRLSA
jgi:hypothetical protein